MHLASTVYKDSSSKDGEVPAEVYPLPDLGDRASGWTAMFHCCLLAVERLIF